MRKTPPRITASYLENAALHYLQRFASSSENLRRVLARKVMRSALHHGDDGDGPALIEALIVKLTRLGFLDDVAYAAAKARSLRRRGGSAGTVRAKLAAKGLKAEAADAALAAADAEQEGDAEWQAALALARRRRLGPYRSEGRAEHRLKDLASLARAGFSYDVARKVVDGDQP